MKYSPCKKFAFRFSHRLPDFRGVKPLVGANKLSLVCRRCGVQTIGSPFPTNGVLNVRLELQRLNNVSKTQILEIAQSSRCRPRPWSSFVLKLLLDDFVLPGRYEKEVGKEVFKTCTIMPKIMPKGSLSPFPMETTVDDLKKSMSLALMTSWFYSSHDHLSLRARPNLSRSDTLRPPRSLGRQTVFQLTNAFPEQLWSSESGFQMKDGLILSIFLQHRQKQWGGMLQLPIK